MLGLLGALSGEPGSKSRRKLVGCLAEVARLVLPYTEDKRVLECIETCERHARGEATVEECQEAAAAWVATRTAAWTAAGTAAWTAGAAAWTAGTAARAATLKQAADIVRKHYPEPPMMS